MKKLLKVRWKNKKIWSYKNEERGLQFGTKWNNRMSDKIVLGRENICRKGNTMWWMRTGHEWFMFCNVYIRTALPQDREGGGVHECNSFLFFSNGHWEFVRETNLHLVASQNRIRDSIVAGKEIKEEKKHTNKKLWNKEEKERTGWRDERWGREREGWKGRERERDRGIMKGGRGDWQRDRGWERKRPCQGMGFKNGRISHEGGREGGGYWKSLFIVLTAKFLTMSIVLQQEKHSTERLVQLIPYYTVLHCSAL